MLGQCARNEAEAVLRMGDTVKHVMYSKSTNEI